jgi:hypothetical protein
MSTGTKHTRLNHCLKCGRKADAISTFDGSVPEPKEGDATLCFYCGAVMRIGKDLRFEGFSDDEIRRMTSDKEWMRLMAHATMSIHFVRRQLKHEKG